MKRIIILALLWLLPAAAQAQWVCDGCSATNAVVIGNVTISGSSSTIDHASIKGNLTVNASLTGITITNTVIDGTPTLGSDATTDQWASTGEVAGAGTPSEAVIALSASPFLSATDLRLHRVNGILLFDTGTESFIDIRGRTGGDIGAYNHGFPLVPLSKGSLIKFYSP